MDTATADSIREELLNSNPEFKELVQAHQGYEKRLSELSEIHFLNDDELLEETIIKKKKLALKDEIYAMISRHSQNSQTGH